MTLLFQRNCLILWVPFFASLRAMASCLMDELCCPECYIYDALHCIISFNLNVHSSIIYIYSETRYMYIMRGENILLMDFVHCHKWWPKLKSLVTHWVKECQMNFEGMSCELCSLWRLHLMKWNISTHRNAYWWIKIYQGAVKCMWHKS